MMQLQKVVIPGLTRNPVPAKALNSLRFRIRSGMTEINKSGLFVTVSDFETTGLSPDYRDRAIEICAVRIKDGVIQERFQQLMNHGEWCGLYLLRAPLVICDSSLFNGLGGWA